MVDKMPFNAEALTRLISALTPWPRSGEELAGRVGAEHDDRGDDRVFAFTTSLADDIFALMSPTGEPPLTLYWRHADPEDFASLVGSTKVESAGLGLTITSEWLPEFGSGEIHIWPQGSAQPSE